MKQEKVKRHKIITNLLLNHFAKRMYSFLKNIEAKNAENIVEEYKLHFVRNINEEDFGEKDGRFTSFLTNSTEVPCL